VDKKGLPVISVKIAGSQYRCVIDTGFNGDLELPEALRKHVNPRWIFQAKSRLAAGMTVQEDVYTVDFPFDLKTVEAEATFVDGNEILIGTHLLRGYALRISFAPSGSASRGRVQIRELEKRNG
jgi:predicted aspartyl protease